MYRVDGALLEETSDKAEHPLTPTMAFTHGFLKSMTIPNEFQWRSDAGLTRLAGVTTLIGSDFKFVTKDSRVQRCSVL